MPMNFKHPILIVDDEPDVLFSLKALLRHDFVLHTAESGEEALQILSQHPVHVIMTDQRMPGMTGVELLEQAKRLYPNAIRIVFTGYADIKAVVEAINSAGLYRYITKPWDPDDLIDTLHAAAKRFEQNALENQFAQHVREFAQDAVQFFQVSVSGSSALDAGPQHAAEKLSDRAQQLIAEADQMLLRSPSQQADAVE
jgi:YesN/AraC family two-component response regulator